MIFFSNVAYTAAYLNSVRNIPELRNRFAMQVIAGTITSIHRGNRLNGTESYEKEDFGDNKIKCLISSADAG